MPEPSSGHITFTLSDEELSESEVHIWAIASKLGLGAVQGNHMYLNHPELVRIQNELKAQAADPFGELLLKAAKLILGSVAPRPYRRKTAEAKEPVEPAAEEDQAEEEEAEPLKYPACDEEGGVKHLAKLADSQCMRDLQDLLVKHLNPCRKCPASWWCPERTRMIVLHQALADVEG